MFGTAATPNGLSQWGSIARGILVRACACGRGAKDDVGVVLLLMVSTDEFGHSVPDRRRVAFGKEVS